ncbi:MULTISPECIES: SDR family NAD(P)-dependent oxidoreductase [Streptomyces]|uniref:Uncharacterized protein n=1 Tax=Streptomyces scabiei (strain 87.22) TaxID=680198 RepID=C9ZHN1_STRSW|nr:MULTISPECIES: SDR family NAD(P)-dependent oxidoreductase [Streptomyces]MDW8471058.1 SDR family NAD(P)-dependent oxidoreductase [Streptomyces scabiei]MDX2540213.1 SDR family NAD(P)-dependent oxidoreductase [Streptomyces scabiei]MDX2570821.1 SDR family NAD(P)-dependent oxidoreductase [Streptomyces scabiei]MDX2581700.1 SDR family NAD(P)-dependent oxidoreductase [Streptomyces scabiei]MDX2629583.1 SDR family NAD(P)-dependent oxidoreductase [Streptomyces scabiei]
MRLQGVNAVITGASSGIGQAIASHFRREGARLLLTGRRPEPPESHPDDLYLAGDLDDERFVADLAARAARAGSSRVSARACRRRLAQP